MKNYAVNAHNSLEAKMRASDINMHEVTFFGRGVCTYSVALLGNTLKEPMFLMNRKYFGVYNIIMR